MSKNNPKLTDISVILLGVAAVAVIVVFSFVDVTLSQIPQINELAKDVIQRALLSLFLVVLCATSQYKTLLNFPVGNLGKQLLALLPCLAVALANFPFSALIKGNATLQNFQYVWLFLIQCVLIGVVEERARDLSVRKCDREFIAHFYKYAFVGIMLDWIRDDMRADPKVIVNRLGVMLHGSIRAALERAAVGQPPQTGNF